MQMPTVGIVQTGTANLASVLAAFRRLGTTPCLLDHPTTLEQYSHVVLPGVGAFGAAVKRLQQQGLLEPLRSRLQDDKPTLGICLGLQLLCRTSEESPGVQGLGLIDAEVTRFPSHLRVPQFGWSQLSPQSKDDFFSSGYAYFANSYCLRPEGVPEDWELATAEYGGPYVAALRRGNVVACQFHPELSDKWGHQLLQKWLDL